MRLRKLDLVIVMLLAGAAFYVFLAETRYHLDLEKLAGITLDNMEYPIGECWAQGQMPVQVTDHEVINLGHISYNPFVYDRPSLNLVKDPMGMPGYYHFTARPLLPDRGKSIQRYSSKKNGNNTSNSPRLMTVHNAHACS